MTKMRFWLGSCLLGFLSPFPRLAHAGVDTPILDLMVVYTPLAIQQAGGEQAILATIGLAVDQFNMVLTNSQVNLQIRLVHTQEVEYVESGDLTTDVIHLMDDEEQDDFVMNEVHDLRDQHFADVVHLIQGDVGPGNCGIGSKPVEPLTPQFVQEFWHRVMFSLSEVQCTAAPEQLSLAHEVSHNLGCGHDVGSGNPGSYFFSRGYVNTVDPIFRTVEAVGTGDPGFPQLRIPNFSNPDVLYEGVPTGVAAGQPGEANNALTITLNTPGVIIARTRPGDVNQDGVTDIMDLLALLTLWSTNDPSADFNDDLVVDIQDLLLLLAYWGY